MRFPDTTAKNYAVSITEEDHRSYVYTLASEEMDGRESGTIGQKRAAEYIASFFEHNGIAAPPRHQSSAGSYFQPFTLYEGRAAQIRLQYSNVYLWKEEIIAYCGQRDLPESEVHELQFAGYATSALPNGLEIQGRTVVALAGNRSSAWPAYARLARESGAHAVILVPDSGLEETQNEALCAIAETADQDATVPVGHPDTHDYFLISPQLMQEIFRLDISELRRIAAKTENGSKRLLRLLPRPEVRILATPGEEEITTENVIGFLPGTGATGETLVISAHYDHVGIIDDQLYPGADDNASGISALLEIAQAFALAAQDGHQPLRNLLFLAFSGEEKGLLGSAHYTRNPLMPLDKTIAALNMDMIGRVDEQHADGLPYVYIIGSDRLSRQLHELHEKVNSTYTQLELDYTYNSDSDPNRLYYRSDQYHFAKHDIPIIFYFSGLHPDYHRPGDSPDKIEYALLRDRTRLVFYTAWHLANADRRPGLNSALPSPSSPR